MDQVNPHLVRFYERLELNKGDCVLVPLCGKSHDLLWLAEQGVQVIGVEVSGIAARGFFAEHNLSFDKENKGQFTVYRSGGIQFWQGDFFKLCPEMLPFPINAIFDRAALVALPPQKRKPYANVILQSSTPSTSMLLCTFEYEQHEMNGPPFAVFRDEIEELFGARYQVDLLHQESLLENVGKFKRRGLSSYFREKVYLLH